jgi:O-antigen ligase
MSRRASFAILAAGLVVPLLFAPVLANGSSAVGLAVAVVGGSLAWVSPALPAALDGLPAVTISLTGSNPLPPGATVTLLAAWALLGVGFAVIRRPSFYPLALFLRLPLALSAALAVLMIIRLGSTPDPSYGSKKVQLFILVNLTAVVVGTVIGRRSRDVDLYVVVLFAVSVLASAALLREIVNGSAQQVFAGRESLSEDFNPILLARSLAEGALICAAFLANRYAPLALRVLAFALLPIFAVTLVATGSRGPLLALVAGLAVLFTLVLRQGRGARYLAVFLGALVASVLVVPRILSTPGAIDRALSVFTDKGSGLSSNGRDVLFTQATDLFRAHPLLGVGTGGFAAFQPIEKYPHNLVLETASELGVVGVLLLVAVVVSAFASLAWAWKARDERLRGQVSLAAALLVMALVNAGFSGDITANSRIWFFVGLATGIAWRVREDAREREWLDGRAADGPRPFLDSFVTPLSATSYGRALEPDD